MSQTGVQARRSAVNLLDKVIGEGRLMSELIGAGALERLGPDDRARAQRLALETCGDGTGGPYSQNILQNIRRSRCATRFGLRR